MRIAKQKVIAGVELVGAGAALTGGSILMEKMVESPPSPQVTRHDNVYAADSSPSFIKIELLAGQDSMSLLEVMGWVLFSLILILLSIPVVCTILKIMKTFRHNTDSYTLDSLPPHNDSDEKYRVTYVPSLPKVVEDTNPVKDMEAAWKDLAGEHDSTRESSDSSPTSEEIVSKNREICSAIESSRRNLKMFRTET